VWVSTLTVQLLTAYSAFAKHLRKNGNSLHQLQKPYGSIRREVLYNILIEFGTSIKLVRLIKMCLNETFSTFRVGKRLCNRVPIKSELKQGDALSPLLFNFVL
jgi:hypothetical protein